MRFGGFRIGKLRDSVVTNSLRGTVGEYLRRVKDLRDPSCSFMLRIERRAMDKWRSLAQFANKHVTTRKCYF